MPRRQVQNCLGCAPGFGLSPRISLIQLSQPFSNPSSINLQPEPHHYGAEPEPGAQPKWFRQLTGGA